MKLKVIVFVYPHNVTPLENYYGNRGLSEEEASGRFDDAVEQGYLDKYSLYKYDIDEKFII